MENNDPLKKLLTNIDQVNEPIDLTNSIMQAIYEEEVTKQKIMKYRKQGIRGLVISVLLIILLVSIYSFSKSFQTILSINLKYTAITTCLVLIFAQLEFGGLGLIRHIKKP